MTNSTHTKTIAVAAVIGALAIAAPASASVLEPVSTGQYSTAPDQQSAQPSELQTVNAAANPARDDSALASTSDTSLNAIAHPVAAPDAVTLRRDVSQAEPFVANVGGTPVANTGDGFDWGDAAIGAGAGLLAATFLMLGSSAIGGRRTSTNRKPGSAVSQGA